jgi:hypothetical protein
MSERARDYINSLSREHVTFSQKHILRVIADHVSDRFGTANVSMDTLEDEILLDRRSIRRQLQRLSHIVEYSPGLGSGNFGCFRFIGIELVTGIKGGESVDKNTPWIVGRFAGNCSG